MHTVVVQPETPRQGRFSWAALLRLLGLMCLGLSWLMPNHYLPWYAFHSECMAFAALMAWVLSLQTDPARTIRVPHLAILVLAAAAVPWLQYAGGLIGFAGEAWVATLYLLGFAGSIYVGYGWARQPRANDVLVQSVLPATLIAGFVSTGLCLFQWLRLEHSIGIFIANIGETGRPFANLAQPNLMATLLVMSVVALAWIYEDRRIGALGLACGGAFLTLGLSFAQSRAGYLSAAGVCAWWLLKHPELAAPRLNRWWPVGWLLLLVLFASLLPKVSAAFDLAGDRPVSLFDNNGRWLMWKQIASGILESPWVGYGWEHTPAAQMAGATRIPGLLATGYAHNIALDAMAWLGMPLGIAVCVAGAFWLASRARHARGQVPFFACGLALPVVVHSLVEFPFAYAFFLFPVGVMFGVVEAFHPRAGAVSAPRGWIVALCLGLGVLGAQIAREYVPAEEDFRFLRFEALRMGDTPPSHVRPEFIVLTQIEALLEVGRITPRPGMSREEIERVRYVTVKYSWAPPAFRYAAVLEANGFHEEAARQMRVIHGMYGKNYYAGAASGIQELRDKWRHASAPRP